jgi:hypothetical protein
VFPLPMKVGVSVAPGLASFVCVFFLVWEKEVHRYRRERDGRDLPHRLPRARIARYLPATPLFLLALVPGGVALTSLSQLFCIFRRHARPGNLRPSILPGSSWLITWSECLRRSPAIAYLFFFNLPYIPKNPPCTRSNVGQTQQQKYIQTYLRYQKPQTLPASSSPPISGWQNNNSFE